MESEKIIEKMAKYLEESIKFASENKTTQWGEGVESGFKYALEHLNFLIKLYE